MVRDAKCDVKVATPVRLELTTSSLEGWRSIRLSYGVVIPIVRQLGSEVGA